jgi:hypothetical protein
MLVVHITLTSVRIGIPNNPLPKVHGAGKIVGLL